MKKRLLFVSLFLISILFISSCAQMAPSNKGNLNPFESGISGEDYGVLTEVNHKCCLQQEDGYMCTEERPGACKENSCAKSNCHHVVTY